MHIDDFDIDTPLKLEIFRQRYEPSGSGPLGMMRTIYALCTHIAKINQWDLDKYTEEANLKRKLSRINED